MNNYCAIPFGHLMVDTTGEYKVCCYHHSTTNEKQFLEDTTPVQWWTGDYMESVRDAFKQDAKHPGCASCWQQEDMGQRSYRQRVEQEYRILGVKDTHAVQPVNAEIRLGNLCNLSCLMCNEVESSAVLAENIRLEINQSQPSDYRWSDASWNQLGEMLNTTEFRVLNLRGGEPFYNKALLDILENMPEEQCRSTVLHITTNATQWNDRWRQALSKFRLVRLMLSVDAVGDLYNYIRYPGSWTHTQAQILEMLDIDNCKPMVHAVVQNLNVGAIGDLIDWCAEHKVYLELDQLLYPEHLRISNLPPLARQHALAHLDQVLSNPLEPHLLEFLTSARDTVSKSSFDKHKWAEFVAQITARDQLRGNSYTSFIKE